MRSIAARVAFGCQPRTFFAVEVLQLEVTVVEGCDEMRRRARRFPARDRPVVQDDNRPSFISQQISRRQTRNAGAHDADVRRHVFRKLRSGRYLCRRHPE